MNKDQILSWWYSLSKDEQLELVKKHFPLAYRVNSSHLIIKSSDKIVQIYNKEKHE